MQHGPNINELIITKAMLSFLQELIHYHSVHFLFVCSTQKNFSLELINKNKILFRVHIQDLEMIISERVREFHEIKRKTVEFLNEIENKNELH